jgi:hypothetical protein
MIVTMVAVELLLLTIVLCMYVCCVTVRFRSGYRSWLLVIDWRVCRDATSTRRIHYLNPDCNSLLPLQTIVRHIGFGLLHLCGGLFCVHAAYDARYVLFPLELSI